ncbi:AsmA family protein [Tepidicaulis marinus]|uniref:AsmA family protein n=1 Tax=Tepidicaulis marinus TaxID=1333998 RepID=A0A081BES1_9HYPH|nr:AsmA family protein [Tepidicaulis marinus]GAK46539.1 AsmA family protein [Tepidicaulis marinus]
MARIALIVFGIIVLLVGGLVAAASFIPAETYKAEIEKAVKQQTGRQLRIEGDVGITFLPALGVEAEAVRFANAEWGGKPDMVSMDAMQVSLKILPLLSGNVELDRFVLVRPEIHLEVNRQGTPNWQFKPAQEAAEAPASPSTDTGGDETPSEGGAALNDIRLGEIAIENGVASYKDARSGAAYEITEINTVLNLPSLDRQMVFDGSAVWNGDTIELDLTADRPRALIAGGETPFTLSLATPKITSGFDGTVTQADTPKLAGTMNVDIPSVRALAAWAGSPLAEGDGFGPFTIKGTVSATPEVFDFSDAALSFDEMEGKGALNVNLKGQRPKLTGKLDLETINTNVYMAGGASASGGDAPASGTPGGNAGGGSAASSSASGWSDAPIDMSGLKAVDADLALSAQKILVQNITIGESVLGVKLNGGVLTADLSKLALYEGAGKAKVTLNGAQATPALNATFDISNIAAYPLLRDAAEFERLEGTGAMNVSVQTRGKSQKQMISALSGNGSVNFANGAIKGINVAQLLRNVLSGALSGWNAGGTQDTDFSELGGTFTIQNGILSNQDFLLLSPLARVSGAGTVNLPQQTLSYRVEPKLAATLEGQGGDAGAKGIEVPIIIEGPWANPKFRPDLKAILSDPEGAVNTIKDLKDGGGKKLLEGLIGKPAGDGESGGDSGGETSGDKPNVEDAIKGLFGR